MNGFKGVAYSFSPKLLSGQDFKAATVGLIVFGSFITLCDQRSSNKEKKQIGCDKLTFPTTTYVNLPSQTFHHVDGPSQAY